MIPKLVLSNTSTFFGGKIESAFEKAKKYGFKYLEIIPYRWTDPKKILELEKKYNIQVAGIHMPLHWDFSAWQIFRAEPNFIEGFFGLIWYFYQGPGRTSPGFELADLLRQRGRDPYVLLHANLVYEMGEASLKDLANKLNLVIENIPLEKNKPEYIWNPQAIRQIHPKIVLDPMHYYQSRTRNPKAPALLDIYPSLKPKIIHIGYIHGPLLHVLPNDEEKKELAQMLDIHMPEYIVVETNPAVNPGKAKALIESLIP